MAIFIKDLQKKQSVKNYILLNFPKPNFSTPVIKYSSGSENPSLLGNVIEYFYELTLMKNINFDQKILTINSRIKDFDKIKNNQLFNNRVEVMLDDDKFSQAITLLKREPTGLKPFKCLELTETNFNLSRIEFFKEVGVYPHFGENFGLSNIKIASYLLIKRSELLKFLHTVCNDFIITYSKYTVQKKVTRDFVVSLVFFTHLSNPWSILSGAKSLLLDNNFFQDVKEILKLILKEYLFSKNILSSASLSYNGVLAKPDFIASKTIIEIKATKKFFPLTDYVQVMLYLMFASEKSNIKFYGKIDKAIIYYPLFGESVEIKNPFNNYNIKKHLPSILKFAKSRK